MFVARRKVFKICQKNYFPTFFTFSRKHRFTFWDIFEQHVAVHPHQMISSSIWLGMSTNLFSVFVRTKGIVGGQRCVFPCTRQIFTRNLITLKCHCMDFLTAPCAQLQSFFAHCIASSAAFHDHGQRKLNTNTDLIRTAGQSGYSHKACHCEEMTATASGN